MCSTTRTHTSASPHAHHTGHQHSTQTSRLEARTHTFVNPPASTTPKPRPKSAAQISLPAAASHSRARPSDPTDSSRRESPDQEQSNTCQEALSAVLHGQ